MFFVSRDHVLDFFYFTIAGVNVVWQSLNVSPYFIIVQIIFEPANDKTNKMACAPSEDADQSGHPPSLIRVFAVRSVGS